MVKGSDIVKRALKESGAWSADVSTLLLSCSPIRKFPAMCSDVVQADLVDVSLEKRFP